MHYCRLKCNTPRKMTKNKYNHPKFPLNHQLYQHHREEDYSKPTKTTTTNPTVFRKARVVSKLPSPYDAPNLSNFILCCGFRAERSWLYPPAPFLRSLSTGPQLLRCFHHTYLAGSVSLFPSVCPFSSFFLFDFVYVFVPNKRTYATLPCRL